MPQQTPDTATAETDPQSEAQQAEELTTDELIEDVSIDGMCGVY